MVWRQRGGSRLSSAPLLLLITSCVGFLVGLFASVFFRESVQLSYFSTKTGTFDLSDPNFALLQNFIDFHRNCTEKVAPEATRTFILDHLFDGADPFEDFPSPEIAPLLRKKRIKGWGAQAPVFEKVMREARPKVIVELGSFLGASAIHMADVARNLSLHPIILCVDDFRGWPAFREPKFKDIKLQNGMNMLYHQFLKNVQFQNVSDVILPVPYSTTAALVNFCDVGVQADLIEVDAAHDFHSAWIEINLGSAILRPGGILFGHDYSNKKAPGVKKAVDLFAKLKDLRVEPDGQHWILRNSSFVLPEI